MSNVQITHSTKHQGRTDVAVAVHPSDPQKLVTAAKHIPAVAESKSHIDVHRSSDEGATWTLAKALLLPAGAAGAMSPSLAWDKAGNLFLAVAAWSSDKPGIGTGIHVYRSTDDGATWSEPKQVAVGKDFPALAQDPRTGNVYLVGWERIAIRCARTTDAGATWNVTMSGKGPALLNDQHTGFFYDVSPASIAVGNESALTSSVLIVWFSDGAILGVRSSDDGVTFSSSANLALSNINATNPLDIDSDPGFPQLGDDHQYFLAPSCAANGKTFAVAWTHPLARQICYRVSQGAGVAPLFSYDGSAPVTVVTRASSCFNPQLSCAADGTMGCAFYEVVPQGNTELIAVQFLVLPEDNQELVVTDNPWLPSKGAFVANAHADTSFVLDPLGLAVSSTGRWHAVWPDTRTGTRELWTLGFGTPIKLIRRDFDLRTISRILFGVIQDGGGLASPGGRVPPYGPPDGMLLAAITYSFAEKLGDARGQALRRQALASLAAIALQELAQTGTSPEELQALLRN